MTERLFPIMIPGYRSEIEQRAIDLRQSGQCGLIVAIPWELIKPHEKQAQANHRQSIATLANRGGLTACEALAVIEDRPYRQMSWCEANSKLAAMVR